VRGRDQKNPEPRGDLGATLVRGLVIAFVYSTTVFVVAATLGLGDALQKDSTVWIVTVTGILGFVLSGHFRFPADDNGADP